MAAEASKGSDREALAAKAVSRIRSIVAETEKSCGGVDPQQKTPPWKYLLQAAQAGHVDSMLRFAVRPPLSETSFGTDLDGWSAYRAEAVPLLERAAATGNAVALYHLFWAYSGFPMPGGIEASFVDPARAFAFATLLFRVSSPEERAEAASRVDKLRSKLSSEQFAASQAVINSFGSVRFEQREDGARSFEAADFPHSPEECESAPDRSKPRE